MKMLAGCKLYRKKPSTEPAAATRITAVMGLLSNHTRCVSQYVPAIEKGIRKTIEKGVVAGYPVVDVEVEVYDGSYHDVDSGPASFELAGLMAAWPALRTASEV